MRWMFEMLSEPMMLDPSFLPGIVEEAAAHLSAGDPDPVEEVSIDVTLLCADGEVEAANSQGFDTGSLVAVVPFSGVVTRRGQWGTVATVELGRVLRQMDAEPSVGAIVLSVDSPGGAVSGTPETAQILYDIRTAGQTKTVAVVDPLMASAATYIATAAEEVYALPTSMVGSIGVINSYTDYSRMLSERGVDVTVVRTPELKARFTGVEPMTDEMREFMQSRVDKIYSQFVTDMARNRGVSREHVMERFGGGELMDTDEALKAGLIDGVASLDEVLFSIVGQMKDKRYKRAAAAKRRLAIESV